MVRIITLQGLILFSLCTRLVIATHTLFMIFYRNLFALEFLYNAECFLVATCIVITLLNTCRLSFTSSTFLCTMFYPTNNGCTILILVNKKKLNTKADASKFLENFEKMFYLSSRLCDSPRILYDILIYSVSRTLRELS